MKLNIFGQIQFDQVPASRALRRFTERHIQKWIQSRISQVRDSWKDLSKDSGKNQATYQVEFSREGSGKIYNCQIAIRLGSQTWIGHNYQGGLQQALIHCLSHQMNPIPQEA